MKQTAHHILAVPVVQRPRVPSRLALIGTVTVLVETWEKQVLSARGFRRVGRRSEYAI
jgi:hypothetical protein